MNYRMTIPVAVAAALALSGCGVFKNGPKKTPVVGQRVSILVSENDVATDKTIAGVQVLLPPAEANAAWTQPGGNAAKSMGHPAFAGGFTRAWTAQIAGSTLRERLAASPVIADGKLYVIDVNAVVHAFSADTGAKLWQTPTGNTEENASSRFGGGVSVEGGRVYAANGLGEVVALDAATGAEQWRKKPAGPLRGAPTLANGNVYVITQDNQLFALNQTDGNVNWTQSGTLESQGVFGVAAPASAQGTVVAGFSSGELNAYRYENGRTLWGDTLSRTSISTSVSALADIDAEPVIDQGRVYAVSQGGRMVALEITSGQRLWEQNIAGISTPWIVGEWIFLVDNQSRLLCIARGSGRVRWMAQLPAWRDQEDKKGPISWVGPILAGGKLVMLSSRGQIASASPEDGSLGQTVEGGDSFSLPPVIANNTLYTLDDKGRLTAYR